MPNYNNGKIYKIVNNIDDMIYIGSTTTKLCYRMNVHKCHMNNNNNNSTLYKHMRKLGIHNFVIVLIEDYPCSNKNQLFRRERYILELHDKQILLNKNRPNRTNIERLQQMKNWHIDNKEYHTNQMKLWFINNKTRVKIYKQKYYQFNKLMQELPFYKVKCIISF